MSKLILSLIVFIAVGACSSKPEPVSAESAPVSAKVAVAESNGPPPPPDAVIATVADAELEAAIRATSPDYNLEAISGEGDSGKARYTAARVDLNSDGYEEVFVYLMGPFFCGTGGCNLLVFSMGIDGYSLLANIPTSESLVIRAETQNAGFSDFWRMQSGGGMPAEYVRHQYKNGKYVEVSRAHADTMPSGLVVMDEDADMANGLILQPKE